MQTHQKTPSLAGWATIRQISEDLGITQNTIRQTVHRALRDQQEWVKREPYPTPNDPIRWLIDTNHAIYQNHARRWQRLAEQPRTEPRMARRDLSGAQATEVTETWPDLCRWLAEHGLVVFVNAIADDQGWQWTWMEHAGSGYPDATSAITAAVQQQLSHSSPFWTPAYTMAVEPEPLPEPEPPLWNNLFRRKG